jgi:uncharacterized protein with HEPN domain
LAKPSPSEGRDEVFYLRHARDAISAILEYTRDGRGAFDLDRRTQDAVIRNLEVLGQAMKRTVDRDSCARA